MAAQPMDPDTARQPPLRLRQGVPHRLHAAAVCLVARGAPRHCLRTRRATARLRLSRNRASCKTARPCEDKSAGENLAPAAPRALHNRVATLATPRRRANTRGTRRRRTARSALHLRSARRNQNGTQQRADCKTLRRRGGARPCPHAGRRAHRAAIAGARDKSTTGHPLAPARPDGECESHVSDCNT